MAEPFIGEIRLFGFNFPPKGWAACEGQILPINQNQALFSLLGTTYGGNGTTTFSLPNAKDRCLISFSANFAQGQVGGEVNHTLTLTELPNHTHTIGASDQAASSTTPSGNVYANTGTELLYNSAGPSSSAPVLSPVGGNQPHNNMMPTLAMNYCIALQGIFPSRN
ncbi:MAG: phage tail protein [Armatimonadetes bacterium]|nr:phage tail protein [Armatimonadota bacterium]